MSLPAGLKRLPPGSHPAVIDLTGKKVAARIVVPAAGERAAGGAAAPAAQPGEAAPASVPAAPAAPPAPASGMPSWLPIALAALAPVLLIALGAWIYFKKILPRKHIEPYRRALELVKQRRYEEALPLLSEAESKLPGSLRRNARFFIAFANSQLDNAAEAEHILAALHREDPKDPNAAYLLAWLRVREKKYDQAEPVLERMESAGCLDFLKAKRLLGIVKFSRALAAFREGRVDAAAELFEKVQELGDFAAQIPTDLRNRHIVLGTQALFEKDAAAARKQFESLASAAGELPAGERPLMLAKAKLGLALAAWVEDDPDAAAALESALVEAAKLFDPNGPLELPWPEEDGERDVVEKLDELEQKKSVPAEQKDVNRCLRDLHFLRGMAGLRSWGRMEGKAAHRAIQPQYQAALARFACARARDAEFSDVYLVVGLLMVHLHKPGRERARGVDLLDRARKLGMRDPDAIEILHDRDKIDKANADVVDKYMQVLDKYLEDETVRREVRLALIERLARYRRFAALDKRPDLSLARTTPPTVEEVRNRSEMLRVRIGEMVQGRAGSDEAERLRGLCHVLEEESERLYQQAQVIEQKESELLATAGDQLFSDERA